MKITLISNQGHRLILSCNKDDDPVKVSNKWLDDHLDYKHYEYRIESVEEE